MDKHYFASLSNPVKIEYVAGYGDIINEIECENFFCSLFLINNFYVELYLKKESNEITTVSIADNSDTLYRYVESLELNFTKNK